MNRFRIERHAGAGEPVHVWPSQAESAPSEFVWRGKHYRVRALEAVTGQRRGPAGGARRFRVRTTSGLSCVLTHDGPGGWRMDHLVPSGGGR
jgi:hypothetical protein